jgi:signal transduction histidine kinase
MHPTSDSSALAIFIRENLGEILHHWEEFARSVPASAGLDKVGLRDHAEKILRTVADDMERAQSDDQQQAKSEGRQSRSDGAPGIAANDFTAAESHGTHRFEDGFDLDEMVSEFRALRASVIRLYVEKTERRELYDLTRFNEGMDQALTESVAHFSSGLDRARQLFMGVLGHDLRSHLQVIVGSSEKLKRTASIEQQKYCGYIDHSTQQISELVRDLLDIARTKLGAKLPLELAETDAVTICEQVLLPFRILYPNVVIAFEQSGEISGRWDPLRLHQLLLNLVRNALQHGDTTRPVTLSAKEDGDKVLFSVHNFGTPIPRSLLHRIFEPMQRGATGARSDSTSVGLGLYIASTIALAHGGTVTVDSLEHCGTTFVASLPRSLTNRPQG